VVRSQDSGCGGQPEPPARKLCCKEWIEKFGLRSDVNADAVVLHLEADMLGWADRVCESSSITFPSAVISSRLVRIETTPARSLGIASAAFLTSR
jgi:hypothetical protein